MKLVMTQKELDKALQECETDESGDALEIFYEPVENRYFMTVDLNHWQAMIPIEVQG